MCGRYAALATPSPTRRTHVRSVFAPGIVGIFSEVAKIIEEEIGGWETIACHNPRSDD